jgi:hypothetical protein
MFFSWSYLVDLSLREWITAHTASSSSRTSAMFKSKQGVSGMTTLLRDFKIGFPLEQRDECNLYKGKTILLVFVDDAILCAPSSKDIDNFIALLKEGLDVTDEEELDDYQGVKVT